MRETRILTNPKPSPIPIPFPFAFPYVPFSSISSPPFILLVVSQTLIILLIYTFS